MHQDQAHQCDGGRMGEGEGGGAERHLKEEEGVSEERRGKDDNQSEK